MASAYFSALFLSINNPFTPCIIKSLFPLILDAIMGKPDAKASINATDKPSL